MIDLDEARRIAAELAELGCTCKTDQDDPVCFYCKLVFVCHGDPSRRMLELVEECERLRAAIAEHHGQRADDRCWMDDTKLYAAAGLEKADVRVGDKIHQEVHLTDEAAKILEDVLSDPKSPKGRAIGVRRRLAEGQ